MKPRFQPWFRLKSVMKLANHFFHTNQESSMQIFKLMFGPRSIENQTFQQKHNLVVQCSVTCALTIYLATGWWSSRQNNLMGPPTHTTWPPRVHHHRPLISISIDIYMIHKKYKEITLWCRDYRLHYSLKSYVTAKRIPHHSNFKIIF